MVGLIDVVDCVTRRMHMTGSRAVPVVCSDKYNDNDKAASVQLKLWRAH